MVETIYQNLIDSLNYGIVIGLVLSMVLPIFKGRRKNFEQ